MHYETAHIYSHCNLEEPASLPCEEAWRELTLALDRAQARFGLGIHSFVLMSNHYHLLLSARGKFIDTAMNWLLHVDHSKAAWPRGWNNRCAYDFSVIGHPKQYRTVFKYIALNPVVAGLAPRVETYPFSTVGPGERITKLPFPVAVHPWAREGVMDLPVNDKLYWLNERRTEVSLGRRVIAMAH